MGTNNVSAIHYSKLITNPKLGYPPDMLGVDGKRFVINHPLLMLGVTWYCAVQLEALIQNSVEDASWVDLLPLHAANVFRAANKVCVCVCVCALCVFLVVTF
jgi:hypothetical protein